MELVLDDKNVRTSVAKKYAGMSEGDFATSKNVGDVQRKPEKMASFLNRVVCNYRSNNA